MNEKLFRPQFDTLKLSDKLWLMQGLAARYHLTFKELYAFSRWGQSCTTGLFEKGGREFVFVPKVLSTKRNARMMQMMFKSSVMADRDSGTKFTRTTASPEILPLMIWFGFMKK